MNRNLAGRCGLYCGACEIYRAYKEAGKLRMDVARRHKCMPAEVKCEGCRAVHIVGWGRAEKWGRNCIILACLKTKNLETCGDCDRISACQKLAVLVEEYEPLGMDLKANLRAMRELRLETWLDQQDARWRCQGCGEPAVVSADVQRCHKCGAYQL